MRESTHKKAGWGTSYGELVWREFARSRLSVICLIFIGLLFSVAILAPFLANDKPYLIEVSGQWQFPLFRGLQAGDYSIFLATFIGIIQLLLIRRNRRSVDPSLRGGVLLRQISVNVFIGFAGVIIIHSVMPQRLDAVDYGEVGQ